MLTRFIHHGGDRSNSHTLSPIATSNRRICDVAIAPDDSTAHPTKRVRFETLDHESSSDPATKSRRRLNHAAYTVGWVAALPSEMAAATAMLDEIHEPLIMKQHDSNLYVFGNVGNHNVVIVCLPSGQYGITKAALVANNMRWSFPYLETRLMVGIGGGVPGKFDIRLGDVVVSNPTLTSPGVIQYDFGKTVQDGRFQLSGALNKPPQELLAAVAALRAEHESRPSKIPAILTEMRNRNPAMNAYVYQGAGQDRLYEAAYDHIGESCDDCDLSQLVRRAARPDIHPRIHYGVIASANRVMKHGKTRDRLAKEHDVICFEMEAAGLMDSFPCLVIRGICDYSDSHKVKRWQEYAASTAAAYAKELLAIIPSKESQNLVQNIDKTATDQEKLENLRKKDEEERQKQQQEERRKLILASLNFDQMDSRYSTIALAHVETCEWLETHPDYVNWLDVRDFKRHHGILWISGKPGAGKSTIMKVAHAKKAEKHDAAVLSFFFNARGERLEKTTEGMHRSLLVQLLKKLPELQDVLEDTDLPALPPSNSDSWGLAVLQDLFSRAISKLDQQCVICFIDALDECAEDEVRQMLYFFEDVGQCAAQNDTRFFVCFSSRHYPQIDILYGVRFTLEDQSGHTADLENYVRSRLRIGTTGTEELKAEILRKASGVFMWVVLVVSLLNKEYQSGQIHAVKRRLREIPPELSNLFRDILKRDGERMDHLLLAIQWILYGKRPLRRDEFYFALVSGLEPDSLAELKPEHLTESSMDRFVVSSSKGLAETTKGRDPKVQFIHESIRDFFLKDNGLKSLWPELEDNVEDKCHERLKQCCFIYARVNTSLYVHGKQKFEWLPFMEYATDQVLYHANIAAKSVTQDLFVQKFAATLQRWTEVDELLSPFQFSGSLGNTLPYIVAERSLANLIEPVMRRFPISKASPKEHYKSPLFAALRSMDLATLRALLPHLDGEEIEKRGEDNRTCLWMAAKNGHTEIVEMLLNAGANPEALDSTGVPPIVPAIRQGNGDIVKLLLYPDCCSEKFGEASGSVSAPGTTGQGNGSQLRRRFAANVNWNNAVGLTALHYAVQSENLALARLLLDAGADVNSSGTASVSPLLQTIQRIVDSRSKRRTKPPGHTNVIPILKLLLGRGANINAVDEDGNCALQLGILVEDATIPQLLLDAGADINQLDQDDLDSALSQAILFRSSSMCEFLLGKGADANMSTVDEEGVPCSFLKMAIVTRDPSIFRILADAGADLSQLSEDDIRTVLDQSVRERNNPTCEFLLSKGADVNLRMARTPNQMALHVAAENGDTDVVETFLRWGADVNCIDAEGRTPLHLACKTDAIATTTALALEGANFRATDAKGYTPIFAAIQSGKREQLDCLLQLGADINARDQQGNTPLLEACQHGYTDCGSALIKAGADATLVNQSGDSALFKKPFRALTTGLLKLLLAAGADPLHRNHRGQLFFEEYIGDVDHFLRMALEYLILPHIGNIQATRSEESLVTRAVQRLIENSAIKDATGLRLLGAAASSHRLEWLSFLVGRGINPSLVCSRTSGHTPLIEAIGSPESDDQINSVLFLLDHGADFNVADKKGETPMELSRRLGRKRVERVLRSRMGLEA